MYETSFRTKSCVAFGLPGLELELLSALVCLALGVLTGALWARKESKRQRISPPCEKVVEQAERINQQDGHENAGFLSMKAAFSPLEIPRASLPPSYACWDQVAASLPHLIQTESLRATVDRMPVLDADSTELPDQYLQRAATVLGVLAHAYVRLEGETSLTIKYDSHDEVLPKALHLPWKQVCQRLGRDNQEASLSYIDLVVYNFSRVNGSIENPTSENMTLETSQLLVPTVNNQEERVFYGTMIEINSKVVPVLHQIIEAHRSVLMRDPAKLKDCLEEMLPLLRRITKTFGKISLQAGKSYVDPIVWTKTVANLAIPWLKGVTGAAGTAHPFFHMMDVFMSREKYTSKIGKEATTVRSTYPAHWQRFLYALGQVSVRNFIKNIKGRDHHGLSRLWATLENEYAGERGLLDIHRRKVYGFLAVSFRIGRNSTINGLGRSPHRKWTDPDRELADARSERRALNLPKRELTSHPQPASAYHFSDLIQHNTVAKGYWFASEDGVYDASSFLSKHPGGKTIIELCSGQDVSADLSAVNHLTEPRIRASMDRHRIGDLHRTVFTSSYPKLQQFYSNAAWMGQKIAETENICRATLSFLHAKLTELDQPNQLTPQKLRHLRETKAKIRDEHGLALAGQADGLIADLKNITVCVISGKTHITRGDGSDQARNTIGGMEEINFKNCDEALEWFEVDFRGLGAMSDLAVALLKDLENLPPPYTDSLNAFNATAVVEKLQGIATHASSLGH